MVPCPWVQPRYPETYEEIFALALRRKFGGSNAK